MEITTLAITIGLIFVIIVLSLATASIASAYNLVFQKYRQLAKKSKKEEKGFDLAEDVMNEEKVALRQKMDEIVGKEAGEFQELLVGVKSEALKLLQNIALEAKEEIRTDLGSFRKTLSDKIDEEIAKTRADLDQYKAQKNRELDDKVHQILKDVVSAVLPDSIDLGKHEELIVKSLEKAKAEHFF